MRIPFERLVEEIDKIEDRDITIGQLAERFNVSTERVMDAIDCAKMLRGERTYV